MKCAVVVAIVGRPDLVAPLLDLLSTQHRRPVEAVLSGTSPEGVPHDYALTPGIVLSSGARGMTTQRSTGVCAVTSGPELICFLDDHNVPREEYVAATIRYFSEQSASATVTRLVGLEGNDDRLPLTLAKIENSFAELHHGGDPGGDTPTRLVEDLNRCTRTLEHRCSRNLN